MQRWNGLRSADGQVGSIEPLIRSLEESGRFQREPDVEALVSELLIPGVLCSAAPKVVSELLRLAEHCGPLATRTFYRIIIDLVETATIASQEFVAKASVGAIEPYASYDALRADLFASVEAGESQFRREFLRDWRGKIRERQVLAGTLLSHCRTIPIELLDRYDLAIASSSDLQWQLRLIESARRVAGRWRQEAQYLSKHLNSDVPLLRIVSRTLLASSIEDISLAQAMEELNEIGIISLPNLLRTVPPYVRIRVYEAAFQCANILPAMVPLYAFDVLRSAFDEFMREYGESVIPDRWAPKYQRTWDFRSPARPTVTSLDSIQRRALALLVGNDTVWEKTTNLWKQFGLPETRDEVRLHLKDYQ